MKIVEGLVTFDASDHFKERLALSTYIEFEEYFSAHVHSEKRKRGFGSDLLFSICGVLADQVIRGSLKEALPLLKKLISLLKIPMDIVKNGKTVLDVCKDIGNWDMYELLNSSEMGESLKGFSL